MNASLFNMLHDAGNDDLVTVRNSIDIHFYGMIQKVIQQYRRVIGNLNCFMHISIKIFVTMNDFHCAPAKHIGWPYDQRITNLVGERYSAIGTRCCAVRGLLEVSLVQHLLKSFPVLGKINRVRRGTNNWRSRCFQIPGQLQWRLPAILHNHTSGFFNMQDFQYVLQCQRLEIQPVRSIVVS